MAPNPNALTHGPSFPNWRVGSLVVVAIFCYCFFFPFGSIWVFGEDYVARGQSAYVDTDNVDALNFEVRLEKWGAASCAVVVWCGIV